MNNTQENIKINSIAFYNYLLQNNHFYNNPIKVKQLLESFEFKKFVGITDRDMRDCTTYIIKNYKNFDNNIIMGNNNGYCIITNDKDIIPYYNRMLSERNSLSKKLSLINKIYNIKSKNIKESKYEQINLFEYSEE